jgi:hypothetical protein
MTFLRFVLAGPRQRFGAMGEFATWPREKGRGNALKGPGYFGLGCPLFNTLKFLLEFMGASF